MEGGKEEKGISLVFLSWAAETSNFVLVVCLQCEGEIVLSKERMEEVKV